MDDDEIRQGLDMVAVEDRDLRVGYGAIGGDRHDSRIGPCEFWVIEREIADLDLVMASMLVALDDDQIRGRELGEDAVEGGLRFVAQFMDDRPALARYHGDLAG